jgi:hypothetical protein
VKWVPAAVSAASGGRPPRRARTPSIADIDADGHGRDHPGPRGARRRGRRVEVGGRRRAWASNGVPGPGVGGRATSINDARGTLEVLAGNDRVRRRTARCCGRSTSIGNADHGVPAARARGLRVRRVRRDRQLRRRRRRARWSSCAPASMYLVNHDGTPMLDSAGALPVVDRRSPSSTTAASQRGRDRPRWRTSTATWSGRRSGWPRSDYYVVDGSRVPGRARCLRSVLATPASAGRSPTTTARRA